MRPTRRPALRHPADREIFTLALPAFGALVAEPLFLLADSAIVGHLGTRQLAGLGVAGTTLTTLVGIFVFLAYATTAAVARRLGAGDLAGALRQGIDGLWLGFGLGGVLLVTGFVLATPVITVLGASPDVRPYAVTYLRISLLGLPAMLLVLAATGVLRGLQDTRTPLAVAATASALNVVLNWALVYPAGLGIAGSALGTVLAQWGSAAAYLVIVVRGAHRHRIGLRPDAAGLRASARAGLPLLVRTLALRAVLLLAVATAARLGDADLAAYQVSMALWSLLALALDAVAIAAQALVGRALGAGDVAAARATTARMVEWGVATGVLAGIGLAVLRPLYVPLFTPDPQVRTLLAGALLVVAAQQIVAGPVFVLDGVLIGAGDGRYLAGAAVVTLIVFVPLAWAVPAWDAGLLGLWLALTGFMLTRMVLLGVRARSDAWLVTGASR